MGNIKIFLEEFDDLNSQLDHLSGICCKLHSFPFVFLHESTFLSWAVEIWAIMCINYFVLVFSRVFLFYWHLHLCLYLHPCIWAGAYSFAQGGWDGGDGGCDDVRASTRSAPEPMCSRATSLSYLCAFFKCISTSL